MNRELSEQPLLTTLGTTVIDEHHFSNGTVSKNVLGGSGVHCAVGARLLLGSPSSRAICGLLHVGHDFPTSAEHLLLSWNTDLKIAWNIQKHSASNIVTFKDATMGPQSRHYVHPSIFAQPADLPERALRAKIYHHICPPSELKEQVTVISSMRSKSLRKPLIMWEPWQQACTLQNKDMLVDVLKHVDVFSPNHLELMSSFGVEPGSFDKDLIEGLATDCVALGIGDGKMGVVVVRCGEYGSLLATPCLTNSKQGVTKIWQPPFHTEANKVICTIGAGNAFLGGLAVGFSETNDWVKACCYASVAASFMVEQLGLPVRKGPGPLELWNGEDVRSRLNAVIQEMEVGREKSMGTVD